MRPHNTLKFWVVLFLPFFPFFLSSKFCFIGAPILVLAYQLEPLQWMAHEYRPVRCRIHFLNFCQIQLIHQFPPVILGMQLEEKQIYNRRPRNGCCCLTLKIYIYEC